MAFACLMSFTDHLSCHLLAVVGVTQTRHVDGRVAVCMCAYESASG